MPPPSEGFICAPRLAAPSGRGHPYGGRRVSDLQLELLRRIVARLERQAGVSADDQELRGIRYLLQALELTRRLQARRPRFPTEVDWGRLLPLLILLLVLLAAVVAALLGIKVEDLLI